MSEIEVKVSRSFDHALGRFTRGRKYQVDPDNPMVKGLIEGGYFVITEVSDDPVDLARIDGFLDSGVGVRRVRPAKRKARQDAGEVDDGQDQAGSNPGEADRPAAGDAPGGADQ